VVCGIFKEKVVGACMSLEFGMSDKEDRKG